MTVPTPRGRPRRQPDPLRPLQRALRRRRPTRTCSPRRSTGWSPASACRASGSARSSPAPCSSTRATSTSRASACSAARSPPTRPPTTSSRPATPASRPRCSSPTRSRSGRSTSASPAASTPTSDAPLGVNDDLRQVLMEAQPRQERRPSGAKLLGKLRPGQIVPDIPRNAEPRTGLSMGEHAAITAEASGASAREDAGRAGRGQPPATSPPPTTAASSTTSSRPYLGLERDQNLRPDSTRGEARQAQAGLRRAATDATMTAGNSTPLTDGASAVLLASDEWASERSAAGARAPHARARPRRSTTCTATRGC